MAIRKVARLGHPILRSVAETVEDISSVQTLIDDMFETMEEYDGAGLAAPQVYESVRIIIITIDDEGPQAWINPVIEATDDDIIASYEGCLSVPNMRGSVQRHAAVKVTALDRTGERIEMHLEGFPSIVAQHECDHLDGILYTDKADPRTMTFLEEYRRFGRWPLEDTDDGTA